MESIVPVKEEPVKVRLAPLAMHGSTTEYRPLAVIAAPAVPLPMRGTKYPLVTLVTEKDTV